MFFFFFDFDEECPHYKLAEKLYQAEFYQISLVVWCSHFDGIVRQILLNRNSNTKDDVHHNFVMLKNTILEHDVFLELIKSNETDYDLELYKYIEQKSKRVRKILDVRNKETSAHWTGNIVEPKKAKKYIKELIEIKKKITEELWD